MANTRCFDSTKSILSASELSSEKRQQVIYNEIQQNVQKFNTGNPVKNNGKKYNRNTIINQTCDISSGYVDVAKSYTILTDVKDGAGLCYPVTVSTPIDSIQTTLCTNLCSNTFDSGFQDTGESGDSALQNLDTNANKDSAWTDISSNILVSSGNVLPAFSLGTGVDRYRNATFLGSCDILPPNPTTPMFVIQFSQDKVNWYSDGVEPSFFAINGTTLQFCFQRSNVPSLWVRLYMVNNTYFNDVQLLLTKN